MQRLSLSVSTMLAIVVFCSPLAALAQAQPTRHLVYNFSVGITQDSIAQNNEIATGSATSDLGGSNSDKGQITVDVSGVEPDGGLVVIVAENARGNHTAKPVTCVVYPDTSEVCGAGDVHPEEQVVLRALSPKFFDASNLDAKDHWQVGNANGGVKIDFTAAPAADGITVSITGERVQKSSNGNTEVANTKYSYDTTKLIPTSMSEYQTMRQQNGAGAYSTTIIDTTATLASDSGLAKN